MRQVLCAVVSALLAVSAIHGAETAAIEGKVLLAQTGEPVAGATVILLETGASTTADRQGEFQFKGVQPGRYHVHAQLESALQSVSGAIDVAPEGTAQVQLLLSFPTLNTQITVSAAGRAESAFESFQSTHSLTSLELARAEKIAAGLGEVLGTEPGTGIAQRGFGPGSSRPIIRGFDGDRVLIMADGLRTGSISSNSGDHAETFNPLSFDRIEVVKGPATLLYGSNAMGGVVNAVSGHAGFVSHPDGVQGYLQGSAGTGNALAGGAAGFDYARGPWRVWGGGNAIRTGDYATPTGVIENSRTRSENGYGGFGWFGEGGFVSVGVRANDAEYGNPFAGEFHGHHHHEEDEHHHEGEEAEEGHAEDEHGDEHEDEHGELRIDLAMLQQAYQVNWGLRNLGPALERFVMKLAYTTYQHEEIEFEGDQRRIGTRFDNDQVVYRGVFEQNRRGPLTGRFGFWGMERDYSAAGEEALAPPIDQQSFALFALEEFDFERVKLQFGGRLETTRYNPAFAERAHGHGPHEEEGEEPHEEGEGPHAGEEEEHHHEEEVPDAVPRRFTGGSAAVGLQADLWRGGAFVANYSHSYRAPALEELYNLGPHVGTLIFEVGDPGLSAERGNGIDLSLRQQAERVDGEFNLFYYDFSNFVFPFATGEEEDGLPVVHFVQRDSRFTGAEARVGIGLHQDVRLNLGMDLVDARATLTRTPLPRIPPLRGRVGIEYRRRGLSIRPELVLANRQNQTFDLELPTAGYAVINLRASYTVPTRGAIHQLSANVFNIGDQLYRNHSSFIKDLAPEIGRGVRFSYMVRFF
ncbi:MAG: TonB-dependent receptor [Bryobacterales bacterium]|nr:TonB-dependent receptor [Bryobacterales bacterium]